LGAEVNPFFLSFRSYGVGLVHPVSIGGASYSVFLFRTIHQLLLSPPERYSIVFASPDQ
jgi:hypothetical protein